jgi:hypothetical protein
MLFQSFSFDLMTSSIICEEWDMMRVKKVARVDDYRMCVSVV